MRSASLPELAWWPREFPPTEQVDMEVVDRLSPVSAGVDNGAEAGFSEAHLVRDAGREPQEVAKHRLVALRDVVE